MIIQLISFFPRKVRSRKRQKSIRFLVKSKLFGVVCGSREIWTAQFTGCQLQPVVVVSVSTDNSIESSSALMMLEAALF